MRQQPFNFFLSSVVVVFESPDQESMRVFWLAGSGVDLSVWVSGSAVELRVLVYGTGVESSVLSLQVWRYCMSSVWVSRSGIDLSVSVSGSVVSNSNWSSKFLACAFGFSLFTLWLKPGNFHFCPLSHKWSFINLAIPLLCAHGYDPVVKATYPLPLSKEGKVQPCLFNP